MNRAEILSALITILEEDTGNQYGDLEESAKLREELGLDSVDVVSAISQIERQFHIRMSHEELERLVTVGDVLTLLESKLSSGDRPARAA